MVKPTRLAAIDIGTNSIRCIVVEATGKGRFRILDDEKATVRLGEGMAASGEISPKAWERAREALLRMKKIVEGLEVSSVEAVATSAVRRAGNGAEFIEDMAGATGIRIGIISGEEEAELAALSARNNFALGNVRYALVDIGGGSSEIVTAIGHHIEEIFSLELGAVVLTERFLGTDPLSTRDLSKLRKHIRNELDRAFAGQELTVPWLIGSGGTVTSIGGMAMAVRRERFDSVHGYEVLRSEVVHLLAMLLRKDQKARRSVPGLNPERADIIVAGVMVIDDLMRFFNANMLRINEKGIREGLILKSLQRLGLMETEEGHRDWRALAEDFALSCHVDMDHARQVAALALQLFDPLAGPFGLGSKAREILEAAALLHDVGYFISYSQHHKHSYHLIRHSTLFGFTPREREIMANVARYHRKALPKKKHESFNALSEEDRLLVRRLGGILRLADGLDRRRNRGISSLRCTLGEKTFEAVLEGEGDLSVELYGGNVKGDLFEDAFRRKLVLSVA
jgi:exopolyphosphatase/guanosine-5'-triphosphate,3'-diphosphate pyrophosphatase